MKFKIRCSKYLYTHRIVGNAKVAKVLRASLPEGLKVIQGKTKK